MEDCIYADYMYSAYYGIPICTQNVYSGRLCLSSLFPCPKYKDTLDQIVDTLDCIPKDKDED